MEVLVSTTKLILVLRILYFYYEVYPGLTELILVLQNLLLFYRSYSCTKVLVCTISQNKSNLYRYISGMDISP